MIKLFNIATNSSNSSQAAYRPRNRRFGLFFHITQFKGHYPELNQLHHFNQLKAYLALQLRPLQHHRSLLHQMANHLPYELR